MPERDNSGRDLASMDEEKQRSMAGQGGGVPGEGHDFATGAQKQAEPGRQGIENAPREDSPVPGDADLASEVDRDREEDLPDGEPDPSQGTEFPGETGRA